MKLLILTQAVDRNDPVLGFFHQWLEEFSKRFEKVTVICLRKGEYNLTSNVKVLSLGKEVGNTKLGYILSFYKYIWQERNNYEAVFVHMNQEYILIAGDIWRVLGKRIYLWRNHPAGSILTRIAMVLSHKVFSTTRDSYVSRVGKTTIMPVGVDTDFYKPDPSIERIHNSVLFLGRISPVKRVLEFLEWLEQSPYTATIAGPILEVDKEYGERMKAALTPRVKYIGPVSQEEALRLYQTHEIFVNKTPPGSFDKTIIEAAACGMKLMVDNPAAKDLDPKEHSLESLMDKLKVEFTHP